MSLLITVTMLQIGESWWIDVKLWGGGIFTLQERWKEVPLKRIFLTVAAKKTGYWTRSELYEVSAVENNPGNLVEEVGFSWNTFTSSYRTAVFLQTNGEVFCNFVQYIDLSNTYLTYHLIRVVCLVHVISTIPLLSLWAFGICNNLTCAKHAGTTKVTRFQSIFVRKIKYSAAYFSTLSKLKNPIFKMLVAHMDGQKT